MIFMFFRNKQPDTRTSPLSLWLYLFLAIQLYQKMRTFAIRNRPHFPFFRAFIFLQVLTDIKQKEQVCQGRAYLVHLPLTCLFFFAIYPIYTFL